MASFKNLTNENKNPSGESNYLSTVISKRKLVFIAKQFRNGRPYRCIYIIQYTYVHCGSSMMSQIGLVAEKHPLKGSRRVFTSLLGDLSTCFYLERPLRSCKHPLGVFPRGLFLGHHSRFKVCLPKQCKSK